MFGGEVGELLVGGLEELGGGDLVEEVVGKGLRGECGMGMGVGRGEGEEGIEE